MARMRAIHPGLWHDEAFLGLSAYARLLWIGLWSESDDNGVFAWKPVPLKLKLLPMDPVDLPDLLDELDRMGLVRRFEADQRIYGAVRNFCRWQPAPWPVALHPRPSGEIAIYVGLGAGPSGGPVAGGRRRSDVSARAWWKLRREVLERDGARCRYCGADAEDGARLQCDHVVPLTRGGRSELGNLAAACAACNQSKGARTPAEWGVS